MHERFLDSNASSLSKPLQTCGYVLSGIEGKDRTTISTFEFSECRNGRYDDLDLSGYPAFQRTIQYIREGEKLKTIMLPPDLDVIFHKGRKSLEAFLPHRDPLRYCSIDVLQIPSGL